MEGIFFYWFSWIGWVIITFFMKKDKRRIVYGGFVLLSIIGSIHYFHFQEITISMTYLIVMGTCYWIISQEKKKRTMWKLLFHSVLLTVATVCFKLFAIYDPVWVIFNDDWMLSFLIVYLSFMLSSRKQDRLLIAIVGVGQGEILFSFILHTYLFPIQIGLLSFLDVCAIIATIVLTWNSFEHIAKVLEQFVQRKQGRKEGVDQ